MESNIGVSLSRGDLTNLPSGEIYNPKSNQSNIEEKKKELEKISALDEKTIIGAIEQANKMMEINNRQFQFSIHKKTKHIVIKEVNIQTKEIIREIPSEKILDMVAKMCELAGLFVDEKR